MCFGLNFKAFRLHSSSLANMIDDLFSHTSATPAELMAANRTIECPQHLIHSSFVTQFSRRYLLNYAHDINNPY